jgi:hypothetical protein
LKRAKEPTDLEAILIRWLHFPRIPPRCSLWAFSYGLRSVGLFLPICAHLCLFVLPAIALLLLRLRSYMFLIRVPSPVGPRPISQPLEARIGQGLGQAIINDVQSGSAAPDA